MSAIIRNLMRGFGSAGRSTLRSEIRPSGIKETGASFKLRSRFAGASGKTGLRPTNVRPGSPIDDIINENARRPGSYATAPFKASRVPSKGDPRAQVMGLARREELSQKAKVAAKRRKAPKKGEAKPYTPPRMHGPNTREEQRVDDLFGV